MDNTSAGIKDFELWGVGLEDQFLNKTHGFVALENFRNASILVTRMEATWVKKMLPRPEPVVSRNQQRPGGNRLHQ